MQELNGWASRPEDYPGEQLVIVKWVDEDTAPVYSMGWLTHIEICEFIVISQTLPGNSKSNSIKIPLLAIRQIHRVVTCVLERTLFDPDPEAILEHPIERGKSLCTEGPS